MNSVQTRLAYLVSAAAVGTALFTACSNSVGTASDTSDANSQSTTASSSDVGASTSNERCVDRNADNPTLRQLYDGMGEHLANVAIAGGHSDDDVVAIREGNSADSVFATLPPELIASQEQILASIPPGGYARYVQEVCEVEEASAVLLAITDGPWAAAFDGLTACSALAQLPSAERDSYASLVEEGLRMPDVSEATITYGVTKAVAAREHLCPQ